MGASSFFLVSFGKASKRLRARKRLLPSPHVFVGWLKDSKKNELVPLLGRKFEAIHRHVTVRRTMEDERIRTVHTAWVGTTE